MFGTEKLKDDKELRSLKSLSDEIRIRILLLLEQNEACVCELMKVFKMTQPRISHHLILLREAGFLKSERRGKWNYYTVARLSPDDTRAKLLDLISLRFQDKLDVQQDRQVFQGVTKKIRAAC
jgi:ArsR family transcriptional regulator